ncbi:NfeD family protein [Labilithrix luteola]|uniref:NfeD family protein n=1 Tax=Labilithrix luteola TaxID=1391654 RepID=UPI001472B207|nr:nodulation protein NfeD [Labilithrix luteola]
MTLSIALPLGLRPASAAQDSANGASAARAVPVLSVDGVVDVVSARYLTRELDRATAEGAPLVVVRLDTPGGTDKSMREMTRALLGARVPVAVYVAPAGARAASAGTYVTMAAGVAAMAPGTEIGAAHPVELGGRTPDPRMEDKVVNDAAALARSIATTRHRNAAWAEQAVRESVSLTADEAVREGVIDLVATDVPDLLQKLDGRSAPTVEGTRTLHTAGVAVDERSMLPTEQALQVLSNPSVAYLLFLLGLLGIVAEVYHPGAIVPGTLGTIGIVLALVAFGNLPISWAGVLLILLAIGLFVAEIHTAMGVLGALALAALVAGSLLLYGRPGALTPGAPASAIRVSPWLIAAMSALVAAFFLGVVRATLRARRLAVRTGTAALVGRSGVALSELSPTGTVRVDSEVWTAATEPEDEPIHQGEHVEVVGTSGVTLRVTKALHVTDLLNS